MKILDIITRGFPVWVLAASIVSLAYPPSFTWFSGRMITVGLGMIMLGMGITLTVEDFRRVIRFPGRVIVGVAFQYGVMPALGWTLAALYDLPVPLAVGLILVASCPGGTASNVISFLAKADVPLSVTMTSVSTMIAIGATPLLTSIYAGSRIDVPAMGLFLSTVQVILLPVTAGVIMNRYLPRVTRKVLPVMPLVAVIFITLIVASIIGAGRDEILRSGWRLIAAVFSLHAGGFFFGYTAAFLITRDVIAARTISIEVGMQNSGLGVVLARSNFSNPVTAIPSAISSLFHSLIASVLAAWWKRSADRHRADAAETPLSDHSPGREGDMA
ncbi:MAG: bile acid:sodium symporter family protein [Spirochaetes bacterium]|nr:bile acid:sodium symporter family protein [Spirochaetota bacterium]